MIKTLKISICIPIIITTIVMFGCEGELNEPVVSPPVEDVLIVGTKVGPDFQETGEFELSFVPRDREGNVILGNDVSLEVTIETPAGTQATVQSLGTLIPDKDLPIAVPLVLDSSGSMSWNDPDRLRVAAGQTFIRLMARFGLAHQAAVFDFGAGSTSGFNHTRMLQDFTSDTTALMEAIDKVVASGRTPLYESVLEVLEYFEQTKSSLEYNRAMVLLADGRPTWTTHREDVCELATELNIPVHTIGLGEASELSPDANQSAIEEMRNISNCTGGIYAAAESVEGLEMIYTSLASAVIQGSKVADVKLDPIPEKGSNVNGTATVQAGGNTASTGFAIRP